MQDRALSCLDVVERRFAELTTFPNALALDGVRLGCGLPSRLEPLDEIRVLLLKRQTTWLTKDAVWKELVRRAHEEPEPWIMAAAGMMVPGLKHIAGKLNPRYPGDKADLDSEILEGFLQALDLAEDDQPKVYSQLYYGAFRKGHEACNRENRLRRQNAAIDDAIRIRRKVNGHPDLILADAVLGNALTEEQAGLLSAVHLDGENRHVVAGRCGLSRYGCQEELARAERKLLGFLNDRIPDSAA